MISSNNGAAITTNKKPSSGFSKIILLTESWFVDELVNSKACKIIE